MSVQPYAQPRARARPRGQPGRGGERRVRGAAVLRPPKPAREAGGERGCKTKNYTRTCCWFSFLICMSDVVVVSARVPFTARGSVRAEGGSPPLLLAHRVFDNRIARPPPQPPPPHICTQTVLNAGNTRMNQTSTTSNSIWLRARTRAPHPAPQVLVSNSMIALLCRSVPAPPASLFSELPVYALAVGVARERVVW